MIFTDCRMSVHLNPNNIIRCYITENRLIGVCDSVFHLLHDSAVQKIPDLKSDENTLCRLYGKLLFCVSHHNCEKVLIIIFKNRDGSMQKRI